MQISRFGPFAVEERLGEGNTGSVYRAVHVQQRRSVALKIFPAPLVTSDPRAKSALVREMETLKGLVHPNIARCYGGILEESHGCIAWELVDGESLAALLSRRGRLAWETVVEYALQISSALEHAHEGGVVHQDLTPEKVMVSEEGRVKVIDFRVDRAHNAGCISSNRRTLERVRYLSPEQIHGRGPLSHKSDLYSLGCLMFEMLVGQPPFVAEKVQDLARHHLETNPPRVDAIVLDCPVWLDSLVGQLLQKDPTRRPYSATAVSLALRETHKKMAARSSVLEHTAGGFSPLERQADQEEARSLLRKARKESRRKKDRAEAAPFYEQPWFLAAALLLLLAGVGAYVFWPASESRLFRRAESIIETMEGRQREKARPYLTRLLDKFPGGEHAEAARNHLDELDMASAERKLSVKTRLGRPPSTEGERLYAEAWNYEQFGDRVTALEKYQSMVNLLSSEGPDRPYVNLARRQIAVLQEGAASEDRIAFIEGRLDDAQRLADDGRRLEAMKIWNSIVTLYGENRECTTLVARALARLNGKDEAEAQADQGESSE